MLYVQDSGDCIKELYLAMVTAIAFFISSIFIILAFYDSTLANINIHNFIPFLLLFVCIFTRMYSFYSLNFVLFVKFVY